MNDDEKVLWDRFWTYPQAVMWEQNHWTESVARYVRMFLESVERHAPVSLQGPVTTLAKELGLTPQGMRMLMWSIAAPKSTKDTAERSDTNGSSVTDIRSRIRAVA